jgi:cytidylate kinase
MKNDEQLVVAIDGPSASGKSTVSRCVAKELGFIYVDSGSLYRGMTWQALQRSVDVKDAGKVIEVMETSTWDFYIEERVAYFSIDGESPRGELRSEVVRECVSDVAAIPEVRKFIVDRLREMAQFGPIVMEGRDIGTVVFPLSAFKFYLDADPEERARRRFVELQQAEGESNVENVLSSLQRRDQKDTTRKTAPLQIALGAEVINTTHMPIEEVVQHIVGKVREQHQP